MGRIRQGFFILILFLLPLINLFFNEAPTIASKLNFLFQIQKVYLVLAIGFVILFYIVKDFKKAGFNYSFLFAGFLMLVLIEGSYMPLFDALQLDLATINNDNIRFDKVEIIGSTFIKGKVLLENETIIVNRFYLDEIPENQMLKIYAYVKDYEDNGFDSSVFVSVNNVTYDVTEYFHAFRKNEVNYFRLPINNLQVGDNEVILFASGPESENIYFLQHHYHYESSIISRDGGQTWNYIGGIIIFFIEQPLNYSPIKIFIFSYKPLFALLAVGILFMGFFGADVSKSLIKKRGKEIYTALFSSIGFFYGLTLVKDHWRPIANIVVTLAYYASSFFFKNVSYDVLNFDCPYLAVSGFTHRICASSSGVESVGYFTLLFLLVLITNWKFINKSKAFLLWGLGLVGSVFVNAFRILSLVVVGIYISPEFSSGVWHTNVGWILFLLYSSIFWFSVLPKIKK